MYLQERERLGALNTSEPKKTMQVNNSGVMSCQIVRHKKIGFQLPQGLREHVMYKKKDRQNINELQITYGGTDVR